MVEVLVFESDSHWNYFGIQRKVGLFKDIINFPRIIVKILAKPRFGLVEPFPFDMIGNEIWTVVGRFVIVVAVART